MQLHKTEAEADWHYVKPQDRNKWQRLAAASKGVLTPANAITVAGALLVLAGLARLSETVTAAAILLIIFGRLADMADGFVADKTGTKSPLGETLDATADKLLALAAVVTLLFTGLLPLLILGIIILQSALNSVISVYVRIKGSVVHPTRSGKLAAAAAWTVIVFYLFYHLFEDKNSVLAESSLLFAWLIFAGFVYFGGLATFSYYKQVREGKYQS